MVAKQISSSYYSGGRRSISFDSRRGSNSTVVFRIARWIQIHTVLLHYRQKFNDDLAGRADEDLTLAHLLGIVDRVKSVVEN